MISIDKHHVRIREEFQDIPILCYEIFRFELPTLEEISIYNMKIISNMVFLEPD